MINNHIPVMINEVKSFLPINKNINLIDATFGGGGYSKAILDEFNIKNLIAIDRDPISKFFFNELRNKYQNIEFFNQKFSKIDELICNSKYSNEKFDAIIFDLGVSSNQIDNSERGFSFQNEGPLDMKMGSSSLNAYEIVNTFDEKTLSNIFFNSRFQEFSIFTFKSNYLFLCTIYILYERKKNYIPLIKHFCNFFICISFLHL